MNILKTTEESGIILAEIQIAEANLTRANELRADLNDLVDQYKRVVVVDFNQVEYVDSSFLGALVLSLKYAVANHADIAVVNLARDIRDLFGLIRLDKVFKIYADKDEAINQLNIKP